MNAPRPTWLVTALMAAAVYFSVYALTPLVSTTAWTRAVALTLMVSAAAVIAVRVWSRSRVLPTLAGAGAAIVAMVPLFAVTPEGEELVLPTPSALGALWQALLDGVNYAATTPAPAEPTRVLVALITAMAVALFLVADHLAASWRVVATAGILLVLPWLPAMFLQYRVPIWALFATALCWLGAMGAARATSGTQRPPVGPALLAGAAALVVAVLVVPSALGGPGWGAIPRFDAPRQLDTATRLNLALDLRTSLTVDSAQPVFSYVTAGRKVGVFRLYTFTKFDGSAWAREDFAPAELPTTAVPLWPEPVPDWDVLQRALVEVQVSSATERNLPLAAAPRTVDVGDEWRYAPERDEVTTTEGSTRGLNYRMVVAQDFITEERLTAAPPPDPAMLAAAPVYTEIPPAVDDARIRKLAEEVTTGMPTTYDAAVAIQDYLRDPTTFTYDTSVNPGGGGDSVSQFLDDRTGYCVQFATTMVMMARSLGIPARLGMGFLGGRLTDPGSFEVRGGDAHAWPELYFADVGWVRFEPTPADQTGAPPVYADVYANQVPVVNDLIGLPPSAQVPPTSVPQPLPDTPSVDTPMDEATTVPLGLIVGVVLLLLAAVAAIWMLRRRTGTHEHLVGPEAAWVALHDGLPEQWRWQPSRTPHEAAEQLAARVDAVGAGFTPTAHDALARLANAVSDHRYAPTGTDTDNAELMAWAHLVAAEATESGDARSRPARDGAQSAPRRGA